MERIYDVDNIIYIYIYTWQLYTIYQKISKKSEKNNLKFLKKKNFSRFFSIFFSKKKIEKNESFCIKIDFKYFSARTQTIRIHVADIDEPPSFVNSPLPMLAVVPLNPTIGRIVYQFVARDEHGDGDSNVLYKTIDVIRMFFFEI